MWFGTEEDSPTNKAKSLRCSLPPPYKRCDSTVHRSHPRARKKRVRACTRARAHTRVRVHMRVSLLDINAQGDTLGKKGDFF